MPKSREDREKGNKTGGPVTQAGPLKILKTNFFLFLNLLVLMSYNERERDKLKNKKGLKKEKN